MSAEIIDLAQSRHTAKPFEPEEREIIACRIDDALRLNVITAILRCNYETAAAELDAVRSDLLRAKDDPALIAGMGRAQTERQYIRRLLASATDKLRADDLANAQWMIGNAAKAIGRLIASGLSEDDERREMPKRRRRIEAARKASETRRRNRAIRQSVRRGKPQLILVPPVA